MASRSSKKPLALTRVKELSPLLCSKEVNLKVIVLECNAKDEVNTSNNATLLVGDDSGCANLVLPKATALQVERVGEFLLLFKENANVSNVTWVKDPKSPDVLIPGRNPAKRPKPQTAK